LSGAAPPWAEPRVTLRCLRHDLKLLWPLEAPLEDLRGSHDLLDAFLDHAPTLRGAGPWLACARPLLYRRFRKEQWRGVSLDEDPALWLLCGGLRRQGDDDDAYEYCCAEHNAGAIGPSDDDRTRVKREEPFRRNLTFIRSARDVMAHGLAEARAHPGGEVPCVLSDGQSTFATSLWCFKLDELEELTCVLDLVGHPGVRMQTQQLEAVMAQFLEGRPASELEYPWTAPRPIDRSRENCFRRLI